MNRDVRIRPDGLSHASTRFADGRPSGDYKASTFNLSLHLDLSAQ